MPTLDPRPARPHSNEESYSRSIGHLLLTREREQELGLQMIEGEAMLLLAVRESARGRAALRCLSSDVASGRKPLRDVVRNPSTGDEAGQGRRLNDLLSSLTDTPPPSCRALALDLAELRLRRDVLSDLARDAVDPGGDASPAVVGAIDEARRMTETARRELVEKNLRLVYSFAKRYRNRGLPFLDVVQEGNLGLMHAIDKFDPRRGLRLSTYASWWIKQYIEGALDDTGATIRVPSYLLEKKRRLLREARRRGDALTEESVEHAVSMPREPISLEAPIGGNDELRLMDLVTADLEAPDAAAERSERISRALAMLDELDARERRILELRFGLGGVTERSCSEIGAELAITGQRVHQIERRALRKLQASCSPNRARHASVARLRSSCDRVSGRVSATPRSPSTGEGRSKAARALLVGSP